MSDMKTIERIVEKINVYIQINIFESIFLFFLTKTGSYIHKNGNVIDMPIAKVKKKIILLFIYTTKNEKIFPTLFHNG